MIRIGNIELTENEVKKIYEDQNYLVTYSKVYAVYYSVANKAYYGRCIIQKPGNIKIGYAKRGRFHICDAEHVNRIVGSEVLRVN